MQRIMSIFATALEKQGMGVAILSQAKFFKHTFVIPFVIPFVINYST